MTYLLCTVNKHFYKVLLTLLVTILAVTSVALIDCKLNYFYIIKYSSNRINAKYVTDWYAICDNFLINVYNKISAFRLSCQGYYLGDRDGYLDINEPLVPGLIIGSKEAYDYTLENRSYYRTNFVLWSRDAKSDYISLFIDNYSEYPKKLWTISVRRIKQLLLYNTIHTDIDAIPAEKNTNLKIAISSENDKIISIYDQKGKIEKIYEYDKPVIIWKCYSNGKPSLLTYNGEEIAYIDKLNKIILPNNGDLNQSFFMGPDIENMTEYITLYDGFYIHIFDKNLNKKYSIKKNDLLPGVYGEKLYIIPSKNEILSLIPSNGLIKKLEDIKFDIETFKKSFVRYDSIRDNFIYGVFLIKINQGYKPYIYSIKGVNIKKHYADLIDCNEIYYIYPHCKNFYLFTDKGIYGSFYELTYDPFE